MSGNRDRPASNRFAAIFALALLGFCLEAKTAYGDIENRAIATGSYAGSLVISRPAIQSVPLSPPKAGLTIVSELRATRILRPYIFELEITARFENVGNVPLPGLAISADLSGLERAGRLVDARLVDFELAGSEPVSSSDGNGDRMLRVDDMLLAPGEAGTLSLVARVDTLGENRFAELAFEAHQKQSRPNAELPRTRSVLAVELADSDGDGAPDFIETADRDGDGISDALDHDPTGYLYCESNGRILGGGRISVESVSSGDILGGKGENDEVVVAADGVDGRYQLFAKRKGRYRLSYEPPPGTRSSRERRPLAELPPGSRPIVVMGSDEFGDSGRLADPAAAANPFVLELALVPGRPVFSNNIPLRLCGKPDIGGEIVMVPSPAEDNSADLHVTYRILAENTGDETLEALKIRHDLQGAFGPGGYTVDRVSLEQAPGGFGAVVNPFFDGGNDNNLLTSGAALEPGERIAIVIEITIAARDSQFAPAFEIDGLSPVNRTEIRRTVSDEMIELEPVSGPAELGVSLSLDRDGRSVNINAVITNPQAVERRDVDLIARLSPGLAHETGTAVLNGSKIAPADSGVWRGLKIPANESVEFRFHAMAVSDEAADQAVVRLHVLDGETGVIISNVASESLAVAGEPCLVLSGTVFVDGNLDGRLQAHEDRVDGAQLMIGDKVAAVSDERGRYSLSCASAEESGHSGEVEIALSAKSLPKGLTRATGPVRVQFEPANGVHRDFAVIRVGEVPIVLDTDDFEQGSALLKRAALDKILRILTGADAESRGVKLDYVAVPDDRLAGERLAFAAEIIREAWRQNRPESSLSLETEIRRGSLAGK